MKSKTQSGVLGNYRLIFFLFLLAIAFSLIFYILPFQRFSSSDTEVKRVYFADNITKAHQIIIDQFNERYAGEITVIPVNLPFTKFNTNERKELIARALRSRTSRIDVFSVDQIWIPRFAKWAEPLTPHFSPKELDDILDVALQTCRFQNQLVSLPLFADIGVMYYRKDLLRDLPDFEPIREELRSSITWERLFELRNEYFPNQLFYMYQGDSYEGLIVNLLEVAAQSGESLFQERVPYLNERSAKKSVRFLADLIFEAGVSPKTVLSSNERASYEYALQHDIPFFRGWPSFLQSLGNLASSDSMKAAHLEMAALPHFKDGAAASALGGWNLMVSRSSQVKNAAIEFIRFALSDTSQKLLLQNGGSLPVRTSVYNDARIRAQFPYIAYVREFFDAGVSRPSHPQYTKISDIIVREIHKAMNRNTSPTQAIATANKRIHGEILTQNSIVK